MRGLQSVAWFSRAGNGSEGGFGVQVLNTLHLPAERRAHWAPVSVLVSRRGYFANLKWATC